MTTTYRVVKVINPNSAPLKPAFPASGCALFGNNLLKYTAAGNNPASASSAFAGFPASFANDGERTGVGATQGNWWKSAVANAAPGTDWLQVAVPSGIGQPAYVNKVVVYSVQNNSTNPVTPTDTLVADIYQAKDFLVQGWVGSYWLTLATVRNNNKAKCTVTFPAKSVTAIRILFDQAPGYGGYNRIVEVEAYVDDRVILPHTYPTLAAAQADVPRLQAREAFLCSGLTTTQLQRHPTCSWYAVADSDPLAANLCTFGPAPNVGGKYNGVTLNRYIVGNPVDIIKQLPGTILEMIGVGGIAALLAYLRTTVGYMGGWSLEADLAAGLTLEESLAALGLTFGGLIAVLAVCAALFAIGYWINNYVNGTVGDSTPFDPLNPYVDVTIPPTVGDPNFDVQQYLNAVATKLRDDIIINAQV